ncbi:TatD family hydrolase [Candidatus Nanopusillus massiliensis]
MKDNKIKILGEIRLDKKFKPETFEKQKEVFEKFLNLAKEYDLNVNLQTSKCFKRCV